MSIEMYIDHDLDLDQEENFPEQIKLHYYQFFFYPMFIFNNN